MTFEEFKAAWQTAEQAHPLHRDEDKEDADPDHSIKVLHEAVSALIESHIVNLRNTVNAMNTPAEPPPTQATQAQDGGA